MHKSTTIALAVCSVIAILPAFLVMPTPAQQSGWPPPPGHTTINIWPGAAPDAVPTPGPEADLTKPTDKLIAGRPIIHLGNVSTPDRHPLRAQRPPAPAQP